MALIDIYTLKDGVRFRSRLEQQQLKGRTVWKCGACCRGNVATATSWEDIDIKTKCPVCKRKIDFDILGR